MEKRNTTEKKLICFIVITGWLIAMISLVILFMFLTINFFKRDGTNLAYPKLMPQLLREKMTGRLRLVLSIIYIGSLLCLYYTVGKEMFVFVYFNVLSIFEIIDVNDNLIRLIRNCQGLHNELEYPNHEDFQEEMFRTFKIIARDIWNYNR